MSKGNIVNGSPNFQQSSQMELNGLQNVIRNQKTKSINMPGDVFTQLIKTIAQMSETQNRSHEYRGRNYDNRRQHNRRK